MTTEVPARAWIGGQDPVECTSVDVWPSRRTPFLLGSVFGSLAYALYLVLAQLFRVNLNELFVGGSASPGRWFAGESRWWVESRSELGNLGSRPESGAHPSMF